MLMDPDRLETLLHYLAEERAHLYFGDDALQFNRYTGELEFTDEALVYIKKEMEMLELTFFQFGIAPKESLWVRIKNLFK